MPCRTNSYQGANVQSCRPAVYRELVPFLISPENVMNSRNSPLAQLQIDCSSLLPVTSPLQKTPIVLDDFNLTHLLGRGGQGKVYLARYNHMQPSRIVAIKIIRKSKLMLEARMDMALREQRVLKNLRGSPFVIYLLASFHDTSYFYLVTVSRFLCLCRHLLIL
jgi:serine/threonine protein kinase